MRRDGKLVVALGLLVVSAVTAIYHCERIALWSGAINSNDVDTLVRDFHMPKPVNCSYDCFGPYPGDLFGLAMMLSFVGAVILIILSWWKSAR